jgi:drug/metabolite transporter (DMT)-like permease
VSARLGELAALATAVSWTATALFFESASRKVGSLAVNLIRLALAVGLFSVYGLLFRGAPLPLDADARTWSLLSLSGLVGFTLGDLCLFQAYVLIGARISSLAMALAPPLVAVLGYLALGERLSGADLLGMAVTLGGVVWVVTERPANGIRGGQRGRGTGLALAFGGALGQAGGLVLSKLGMGAYDAFAATHIRALAGTAGFVLLFTAAGWWPKVWSGLSHRAAMAEIAGGAFFGPFLGVGLSLVAVQRTQAGIAATIMALTPVLILPVVHFTRRERVSVRAAMGALLAVAGVALLFR